MIDTDKASLTDLRKQLRALETAKAGGYNVPQPMLDLVAGAIRTKEGIVEVWECDRCPQHLEFGIRPKGVSCKCGKVRRVWKA